MKLARKFIFILLASFILLGPAVEQVFGYKSVWMPRWIMYSGVGVGILKGTFHLARPNEPVVELTPLGVLSLDRYPMIRHYEFDQTILEKSDLRHFASRICDDLPSGGTLSFIGSVGTRQGWQAMNVADICKIRAPGKPKTRRFPETILD